VMDDIVVERADLPAQIRDELIEAAFADRLHQRLVPDALTVDALGRNLLREQRAIDLVIECGLNIDAVRRRAREVHAMPDVLAEGEAELMIAERDEPGR